ncbi:MAG: thioredoxin domain-containing protein [Gemmatimonadota bacterium]
MALDPHAAASPVRWLEWGPAAFERARREQKPILLRISAVWCHWCHVMDETTDADPEVARRMNEWFVPVRVDNDERPDINDRYNLGGWPTTAFLTPDGELITGGTYFPADAFHEVLERIHRAWTESREQLDAEVGRIRERRRAAKGESARGGFDADAITGMVEAALDAYDWRFGGFGTQPKFPHPEAVRLLLHAHAGSGAEAPREAAGKTLEAMRTAGLDRGRNYGLYDHVAGGFFRYSTTRDWTDPHFEKMAEDNARLALAYLDGWRLLGDDLYADTVRGIFGYVLATLSDPEGGAFGSQDADGEAEYYGLPSEGRTRLPTPYVDRRFYTSWSGMLAAAAFEAAAALEWPELQAWALRTVDRLTGLLAAPAGAMRHVARPAGKALGGSDFDVDEEAPLLLTDQAWWLKARLAAYQSTGNPDHLRHAEKLVLVIERDFIDARRGACRDRPGVAGGSEGALADPHFPLADNAAAAEGLAAFAALSGAERWHDRALEIVNALQPEAARHGFLAAPLALAAVQALGEPIQVHLVGPADDGRLRALWRTAWRRYAPARVTEILDPALDGDRLSSLGYPADGPPRAYVCVGERCLEPVTEVAALAGQLDRVTQRSIDVSD